MQVLTNGTATMNNTAKLGIAASLLLVFITAIYLNHFDNGFQFDDSHTIVNNMYIRDAGNIPLFFQDAETFSTLPQNQSYRPIVTTSLAIDYWLAKNYMGPWQIDKLKAKLEELKNKPAKQQMVYQQKLASMRHGDQLDPGLSPIAYHLDTFFWFLIQGVLMFFLYRLILNKVAPGDWNNWLALFITSWYMVHTVNAETLNYIISRSDLYSTLLVVAGLLMYVKGGIWKKGFLYLIPIFIGILAKPTAVMFFPILVAYIILFEADLSLLNFYKIFRHKDLKFYLAHIFISAGVCALGYWWVDHNTPDTWIPGGTSPLYYLATQTYVMAHYFRSFFLPTELTADTDWKALTTLSDSRFFIGMVFIIVMVAIIFITSRKREWRPVSLGLIFFFVALIPTSSIIPLAEVMNDHRMYFPFVGLALSVGWTIGLLVKKWLGTPQQAGKAQLAALGAAAILIIGAFGYGTYQRNIVWNTGENLWKDVTEKSPNNGRGWMNYGLALMEQGRLEEAYQTYLKAQELTPNYSYLEINTGIVLNALGRPAEAEPHYIRATQLNPGLPEAFYYYGSFLYQQRRLTEARMNLNKVLELAPAHFEARYVLMAVLKEANEKAALKELAEETLSYLPNDPKTKAYLNSMLEPNQMLELALKQANENPSAETYLDLSLQYYKDGQYEKCVEAAKKSVEFKPDYAEAYNNMCAAYNQLHQWDEAIEACNQALLYAPEYELARNNLNWAISQKELEAQ